MTSALRFVLLVLTALAASILVGSCASAPTGGAPSAGPIAALRREKTPTLVLVSIDGLRYDFARMHGMSSLLGMAAAGATAQSLIPVYPSKTFPNHYSIVTGCYSDQHGLVSNEFFDPALGEEFAIKDRAAVESAVWYGCDPIWNVVEKHGGRSAAFYWVGSEAPIGGHHLWQWRRYDKTVSNAQRVDQVLDWLRMPDGERPRAIFLYFSSVDSAAHLHGPESPQASEAARDIDLEIGRLRTGIARIGRPTNVIVVSDHGMLQTDPKKIVWIEDLIGPEDLAEARVFAGGPQALIYFDRKGGASARDAKATRAARERSVERRLARLEADLESKRRAGQLPGRAWRRANVPARLRFRESPRVGDLVIDMDPPWMILSRKAGLPSRGNHGWDPRLSREMHGSFFAEGPAFKAGAKAASFENVDLYPVMLRLLDLSEENAPNSLRLASPVWKTLAEPYALEEPKK